MVSFATIQLYPCNAKVAIDNTYIRECVWLCANKRCFFFSFFLFYQKREQARVGPKDFFLMSLYKATYYFKIIFFLAQQFLQEPDSFFELGFLLIKINDILWSQTVICLKHMSQIRMTKKYLIWTNKAIKKNLTKWKAGKVVLTNFISAVACPVFFFLIALILSLNSRNKWYSYFPLIFILTLP